MSEKNESNSDKIGSDVLEGKKKSIHSIKPNNLYQTSSLNILDLPPTLSK